MKNTEVECSVLDALTVLHFSGARAENVYPCVTPSGKLERTALRIFLIFGMESRVDKRRKITFSDF